MKPGNLLIQGAKSGGKRKMRIRFLRTSDSRCAIFSAQKAVDRRKKIGFETERNIIYGKKTLYFRMRHQGAPG